MTKKKRNRLKPIVRKTPKLRTVGMGITAKPLPMWDRYRFMVMAADRGFQTERGVIFYIADKLKVPRRYAQAAFSSGRWKWEQMLVIGSIFEMTPKEFCDIFLHGYFRETREGHYRCVVDNPMLLLYPPKTRNSKTAKDRMAEEVERIKKELENL